MRHHLRKAIPSMFHRRLALLGLCMAAVLVLLGAQTIRLTTGRSHYQSLDEAESVLQKTTLIETVRGRILDRNGRVLAYDDQGWEIAVRYPVINGTWVQQQAEALAKVKHKADWSEMDTGQRATLVDLEREAFEEQVEMLWQMLTELGQTSREELDRRRDAIRRKIQVQASHHNNKRWERLKKEMGENIPFVDAVQEIREQEQAHMILPMVDEGARVSVQSFITDAERKAAETPRDQVNPMKIWLSVELRRPKNRVYPFETMTLELERTHLPKQLKNEQPQEVTVEGVGGHLLGSMRGVWARDLVPETGRPFRRKNQNGRPITDLGGYLAGDDVGHGGVEGAKEFHLRGTRGTEVLHVDTQEVERFEPKPGTDVQLTLDINLQARVQAIMTPEFGLLRKQEWHGAPPSAEENPAAHREWKEALGTQLNGAAVVLDAETSEVLAAVTMPTMPKRLLDDDPDFLYDDVVNVPWVNRTISRPYQPGSTIKPIMLVSAVSAGRHSLGHPINCRGPLDLDHPEQFRCWIFKRFLSQHGPLMAPEAIARSCNVYFYTLGKDMGQQRTLEWYGKFGLGRTTDCGLGTEEVAGWLGNPKDTYPSDPINMGIGQGPVSWTPMQAAGAYATLARGGLFLTPTILRDADRNTRRQAVDLNLSSGAVREAIQGLDEAVNQTYGTGHHLSGGEPIVNIQGARVMAKSGTADPGKRLIDSNGNGKRDPGEKLIEQPGDHAWFVALVQPEGKTRPTHVIAVVVEYAGSGGLIAGPVVNQIAHALQKEGYL